MKGKRKCLQQKAIEIDRNVDSEDKAIKDNRGKKPNGYYIDVFIPVVVFEPFLGLVV